MEDLRSRDTGDLHPLEQFALLARYGEVSVEPYRDVKHKKIVGNLRAVEQNERRLRPRWELEWNQTLHTTALKLSIYHGTYSFASREPANAFRRVALWPTEWHTLPNGETHGLRRAGGTFVHDGNYDPAVAEYLAELYQGN